MADAKNREMSELFRAAFHMHQNHVKYELSRRGISAASHPTILLALKNDAENMTATQKELAGLIGVSAPTVAVSVRRMERAGLLRTFADSGDLRRKLVTLSARGLGVTRECEEILEKTNSGMLDGFLDKDRDMLAAFYMRFISNLEDMGALLPGQVKKCLKRERSKLG